VNEFGFLLDDSIINGLGSGQPLGILNAGCLVQVSKETGQKAATIVAENVIKMYSRIFASSRSNAVWLINQNIESQLFQMSLAIGTGGIPIYMPAGGLSGLPYGTLFGRPVLAIEQAATLGTLGDILFVDLASGYILAEKGGIKSDMSIHVRFDYDESVFRFVMRVDGQPVRATVLTPYKGASDTQSHFVGLATRA
jgi:HK97 family phage major capsid protein